MKRKNLASAVFLVLFSLLLWVQALKLPLGTPTAPETGLWPLVLVVLLSLGSIIFFIGVLRDKAAAQSAFFSRPGSWKPIALSLVFLFLFVFVLERLGYVLSTLGLIAVLLRVLRPQRWWVVFSVASVTAVVSYLLFGTLLGIDLPKGILGM